MTFHSFVLKLVNRNTILNHIFFFYSLTVYISSMQQSLIWTITGFTLVSFQDCSFKKLQSDTAIKVSFQGNMRVSGSVKCNRWFFKFNGNECSGPMTIEAVVYNGWPSGSPNLLHHRSFEGYCENIPQGTVIVELWVGQCSGNTLGNANTGWNSVSRIMIEEVSRAQS